MTEKTVPIEDVILDERCQARAEVSHETVTDYADAYRSGAKLPHVDVFAVLGKLYLVDGFHRVAALRVAGESFARVRIVGEGDLDAAIWHATSVNAAHGLRRSNADKRRAVLLALRSAIGSEQSSRTIAEHVGVSPNFVTKVREDVEGRCAPCAPDERRTGKDGKSYPAKRQVRTSDTSEIIGPEETRARIEAELEVDDVPEPLLYPHERVKRLPTFGADLERLAQETDRIRRELSKLSDCLSLATLQRAENGLVGVARTLRMAAPVACEPCGGQGCPRCADRGWRPVAEVAS